MSLLQVLPENNPKSIWKFLFHNQIRHLEGKAHIAYFHAMEQMKSVLNEAMVPNFDDINQWFTTSTGWEIVKVPGLIKDAEFFELLANKQFPSSQWLRDLEHLGYLEEPDMFHDIFGHIPLLVNPQYADIMWSFGAIAQRFEFDAMVLQGLQKLYWFTIEFGLMLNEEKEQRIFGAGILSSADEATWALEHEQPLRKSLNLSEVLATPVVTDQIQNVFFVADSFAHIKTLLNEYENNIIAMVEERAALSA